MNDQSNGSKTGLEPIAKRVSIEHKIDLRFPNFEGLITRMSANLSTSGMFVQTDTPRSPATEFDFQIRIEEWSPIQGTARVIWTRAQTQSPERPAGMGVQFLELDPQSRRMIRWLVDKHRDEGGRPFDVDQVPAGASQSTHKQPPEIAQNGRPQTRRRSKIVWAIVAVIALLLSGFGAYRLWLDDRPDRGHLRSPEIVLDNPGRTPNANADATTEAVIEADPLATSHASAEAVNAFVRTWSAAWENRDAEALKSLYGAEFDGSAYGGRRSWESEIDQRIEASDYIRIAVSALEIGYPTADTATATFYRSIRSSLGDETRRMVLELKPSGNSWKIVSERLLD